eukprot:1159041-Pelagomonas_calceolata.AAC.12
MALSGGNHHLPETGGKSIGHVHYVTLQSPKERNIKHFMKKQTLKKACKPLHHPHLHPRHAQRAQHCCAQVPCYRHPAPLCGCASCCHYLRTAPAEAAGPLVPSAPGGYRTGCMDSLPQRPKQLQHAVPAGQGKLVTSVAQDAVQQARALLPQMHLTQMQVHCLHVVCLTNLACNINAYGQRLAAPGSAASNSSPQTTKTNSEVDNYPTKTGIFQMLNCIGCPPPETLQSGCKMLEGVA